MMTGVVPNVPQCLMRFMLSAPVVPASDDVVTSSESVKGIDLNLYGGGSSANCDMLLYLKGSVRDEINVPELRQ